MSVVQQSANLFLRRVVLSSQSLQNIRPFCICCCLEFWLQSQLVYQDSIQKITCRTTPSASYCIEAPWDMWCFYVTRFGSGLRLDA